MPAAPMQLPLLLLLLLLSPAHSARRGGKKWRPLPPDAGPECAREFHDPQSKWIQSDLVVRGRWRASDESTPTQSGAYNVTVTVRKLLKQWTRDITAGQRITIGIFNGTLKRSQMDLQKAACTPCQMRRGKGHVFFLRATSDPNYFRHAFLPIRFNSRVKTKFERLQCNQMQACPKTPRLVKPMRKRAKQTKRHLTLRLVCKAADGLPKSKLTWLKDGAEVVSTKDTVTQFKSRKGVLILRLLLKRVGPQSAGNYTCMFRNVEGSVSSSLQIQADELLSMAQQQKPTQEATTSTTESPMTYLCNLHCFQGGTCMISKLTNEPYCLCQPNYNGYLCEKYSHIFDEHLRRGLARSLASAGISALPTTMSVTGAVLILSSVTVIVVLLAICCIVMRIRRRLDKAHWTAVATRNGPRQAVEEHSRSNSVANRTPKLPPLVDAATMTDEAARHGRDVEAPTKPPGHQPSQPPPPQYPYFYPSLQHHQAMGGRADADAAWQLQPLLANGPALHPQQPRPTGGRSRNPSSGGGGGAPGPGVAPYTYQSPGHSTLPPVRIRPVFDYGEASAPAAAAEAAEAAAAASADPDASEPIDLLKEFNRIEWLQQQQQQQQQTEPAETASAAEPDSLPTARGRSQHLQAAPAQGQRKQQLLPFPGHGPPSQQQQQQQQPKRQLQFSGTS